MDILKSIFAFFVGLIVLLLFYYLVSIPIIPGISIYVACLLFTNTTNSGRKVRTFLIFLLMVIGIIIYGNNTFMMFKYRPEYGNWLAIILEALTTLSIFSAWVTLNSCLKRN